MTTPTDEAKKELLLAILAMDSYNRGYGAGVSGLGGIGSIVGSATLTTDSTQKLGITNTSATGFYAAAYTLGPETVISYRGTDSFFGSGSDIYNGWLAATGLQTSQVGLAYQFYNSVLSKPGSPITYDNGPQANVMLSPTSFRPRQSAEEPRAGIQLWALSGKEKSGIPCRAYACASACTE